MEIILLWAAILVTLVTFWNRSKWAGGLLAPYLAWVSFASLLATKKRQAAQPV